MLKLLGVLGQWLAVLLCSWGIVCMYTNFSEPGTLYITIGALVLTIATKVRYYGEQWIEKRRNKHFHKSLHGSGFKKRR